MTRIGTGVCNQEKTQLVRNTRYFAGIGRVPAR